MKEERGKGERGKGVKIFQTATSNFSRPSLHRTDNDNSLSTIYCTKQL